ncbi:MAG: site-specific integrase [Deltaproteobacteria bacterium]|nr:site-specific integrase [Deltaproteobacteria bacterium]
MGLFKRGSVWWMSFIYQGKQYRKSTETNDGKLAKRIYDKVKGEIAEGKWFEKLPGEEKTFTELMEKYMAEHSARNKAPKSHNRDKSLKVHLLKDFGDLTLVEITPMLISAYKARRRGEGASPRTLNYELALMSHAFNLALKEWEWTRDNPVRKVSKEKVNNQVERWLTLEEEEKLIASSLDWIKEIISFAIATGLRESEILDLKWPQVNMARKTIEILVQKNKGKDTLPLNKRALEILEQRSRSRLPGVEFVFCTGKGTRIGARNLLRGFYSALKKAKITPLRFHDLRHTFATRLVQAGVDLYTVQKLGRWKNISMVMRYAHHYPESLRSGVEVLDRIGKKISTNLAHFEKKGATEPVRMSVTP